MGIFEFRYKYFVSPPESKYIIHIKQSDKWIFERTKNIDRIFAETIGSLVLSNLYDKDEDKLNWIIAELNFIKFILSNLKHTERIILASQWLFESYFGNNELLSYIQATIVIEILLGDKAKSDIMGLTELLANRSAYLIGKSFSGREKMLKEFREIYN